MPNGDSDNPGRGAGPQYPLPLFGTREQAEFTDVIRLLEEGKITPEAAQKRLNAFFQLGTGAWIRALGVLHPDLMSNFVDDLTVELGEISSKYAAKTPFGSEKDKTPPSFRLENKNAETLVREWIIVTALTRSNRRVTTSELLALIKQVEPDAKTATISANLDRLWKVHQIDRPRKGYYAKTPLSEEYLAKLEREIAARDLDPPKLEFSS